MLLPTCGPPTYQSCVSSGTLLPEGQLMPVTLVPCVSFFEHEICPVQPGGSRRSACVSGLSGRGRVAAAADHRAGMLSRWIQYCVGATRSATAGRDPANCRSRRCLRATIPARRSATQWTPDRRAVHHVHPARRGPVLPHDVRLAVAIQSPIHVGRYLGPTSSCRRRSLLAAFSAGGSNRIRDWRYSSTADLRR